LLSCRLSGHGASEKQNQRSGPKQYFLEEISLGPRIDFRQALTSRSLNRS
jgi:hypothetical protein